MANPMQLVCDDCGPIDHALLNGYHFGDRLLEDVYFKITVSGKKLQAEPATIEDDAYLDDLNKKKWLREAMKYASDPEALLDCPSCKNNTAYISPPILEPNDI